MATLAPQIVLLLPEMGAGASSKQALDLKEERQSEEAAKKLFGTLAVTGETLSVEDIYNATQAHGKLVKAYWSRETIEAKLAMYDGDKDGRITCQEYLAALADMTGSDEREGHVPAEQTWWVALYLRGCARLKFTECRRELGRCLFLFGLATQALQQLLAPLEIDRAAKCSDRHRVWVSLRKGFIHCGRGLDRATVHLVELINRPGGR